MELPIFPLGGALLLPWGRLPMNIFEPRYLNMILDALGHGRIIGMVQPNYDKTPRLDDEADYQQAGSSIYRIGCAGRISSFEETEDGRLHITLKGLIRFHVLEELEELHGYRRFCVQDAVYPGLVAQPTAVTQGVLYCNLEADTFARLDTFEDGMYDRRSLAVEVDPRPPGRCSRSAEVYVTRSSERARLSPEQWDPDRFRRWHLDTYLQRCAG